MILYDADAAKLEEIIEDVQDLVANAIDHDPEEIKAILEQEDKDVKVRLVIANSLPEINRLCTSGELGEKLRRAMKVNQDFENFLDQRSNKKYKIVF